jgi:hypothetical protein
MIDSRADRLAVILDELAPAEAGRNTRDDAIRLDHATSNSVLFGRWKTDTGALDRLEAALRRAQAALGDVSETAEKVLDRRFREVSLTEDGDTLLSWNIPLSPMQALANLQAATEAALRVNRMGEPPGKTDWRALAILQQCCNLYVQRTGQPLPKRISADAGLGEKRGPFHRFAAAVLSEFGFVGEVGHYFRRLNQALAENA